MWRIIGSSLGFFALAFGVLMIAVVCVSALILAVATGLSYIFSVSVWEAAVVVTAVSAAVYFKAMSGTHHHDPFEHLVDLPYDDESVSHIVTDLPDPPNRSRRRRRRL